MATGLAAPTPQQFFLDSGAVNALGTVETYLVGTSTPVATFTDYDLGVANSTTVSLNAAGRPTSGGIYLDSTIAYKFIEKDALGATVKTYNIAALFNGPFTIAGNVTISGTLGVTGATTLSSTLGVTGITTLAAALNVAASGNGINRTAPAGQNAAVKISAPSTFAPSVRFDEASTNIWQLGYNLTGSTKAFEFFNTTGSATRMSITEAGVVRIGGTLNVVTAYQFNGTAGLATFGPSAVASLTVKGGLVTAAS